MTALHSTLKIGPLHTACHIAYRAGEHLFPVNHSQRAEQVYTQHRKAEQRGQKKGTGGFNGCQIICPFL